MRVSKPDSTHAISNFRNMVNRLRDRVEERIDCRRQQTAAEHSPDYAHFAHLDKNRKDIFCTPQGRHIDVWDVLDHKITKRSIRDNEGLIDYLEESQEQCARFISVCAQSSTSPLGMTYHDLHKLIHYRTVGSSIINLFCMFGDKASNAEAGSGRAILHREEGLNSFEICYNLTYPEPILVGGQEKWAKCTVRQVGAYHLRRGSREIYVFLHAKRKSRFQQYLESCMIPNYCNARKSSCFLHSHVLAFYSGNWRWYLRAMNSEFEKLNDVIMTMDLQRRSDNYNILADRLLDLQHLVDRAASITTRIESTHATLTSLIDSPIFTDAETASENEMGLQWDSNLCCLKTELEGYLSGSRLLQKRIKSLIRSMSMAIEMRNQRISIQANDAQLQLAHASAGDNATVHVVTLVTLIFLPASFVATLLGTNLFTFGTSDNAGFQMSSQFWIFFAISMPLTMVTVGAWLFIIRRRQRRQYLMVAQSEDIEMS